MRLLDMKLGGKNKMIFKLFSIKDELSGFAPSVPFITEEEAVRYFRTHLEQTPIMVSNPTDYSLWYLGTFDTESGTIICTANDIRMIERGKERGNNKIDRTDKIR